MLETPAVRLRRKEFLRAIARVVPEVLTALQRDVWPVYRTTFGLMAQARAHGRRDDDLLSDSLKKDAWYGGYEAAVERDDPVIGPLSGVLERWITDFNLDSYWVRQAVINTLIGWAENPKLHDPPSWVLRWWTAGLPSSEELRDHFSYEPVFSYEPWDQTCESRGQFRTRMIGKFTDHLDRHLDVVAQLAEETGFEPAPEAWTPQHAEWAALRQARGLRYSDIAREYRKTDRAISQAVRPFLHLIGLPQGHTSKGGRPHKRSSSD
jgi:hypothetical protein